jgi:hypothetical protein
VRDNDFVSDTLGVCVSTTDVAVATITTSEDGTPVPSSLVRPVLPTEHPGEVLADVLGEISPDGAHVVADVSAVLDEWLSAAPTAPSAERALGKVTVVRISPSRQTIAEPFDGWPAHLVPELDGGWVHLTGGVDLHGGRVRPADTAALDEAIRLADQHGSVAICVSAMGALLDSEIEYRAADHLLRAVPERRVFLAQEAGGRRFLEREKSGVLAASLLPAVSRLLDGLEEAVARTGSSLSLVGADGALLSVEDARAVPVRLLGSTHSLVAQGAAALAGVTTAVILVWDGKDARLLTIEQGVLRTRMVRRSAHLGDLRFSQRHAVQSILRGPAVAALTRDLVDDRPMVLTRTGPASNHDAGFEALTATLVTQLPEAHVVIQDPRVLVALGARASLPQSEIVRYAVVSNSDEVEQVRHFLLQIAQGRVLAAANGPVELRTLADHFSPLSFLTTGPVLLSAHVVGFPPETS